VHVPFAAPPTPAAPAGVSDIALSSERSLLTKRGSVVLGPLAKDGYDFRREK
jgi:hypothetical protein